MRSKSLHRKTRAFSDYIRYALPMGNGVIRLKGNGYLRSYAYRGPDLSTSSWSELQWRSDRLGSLLRALDDQWSIHVDAFRVPSRDYPMDGFWPDRLTYLLDQDRRVRYQTEGAHYETRYVLSLAYYPRRAKQQRAIARMFYDSPSLEVGSDDAAEAYFREVTDRLASDARQTLNSFEPLGWMEAVNALGRPLLYDETCSFLSYCVRGETHPIALVPDEPNFLDGIIAADDVRTGWDLRVGKKWVAVLTIEGYPGYSYPGILDALAEQPLEYRFSQRFVPLSKRQADARLAWLEKGWGIVSLGGVGLLLGGAVAQRDDTALSYKEDARQSRAEAKLGLMYGSYLAQVVLHADSRDERDRGAEHLRKAVEGIDGFSVRVETENVTEAFLASLPGERDASEYREAKVSITNLGHMLPLTSIWAGPVNHPNPRFGKDASPLLTVTTNGITPLRAEPYVGEVGHLGIFGVTRGGKSTLLMALVAAFLSRYRNARVFQYDVGFSAYKYCQAAGGTHYRIGSQDGPQLAPLTGARDPERRRQVIQEFTETYEINRQMTVEQQRELREALTTLVNVQGEASFSDLAIAVQDEAIREVLAGYENSFLDARTDTLDFAKAIKEGRTPYFVFEYEELGLNNTRLTQPFIMYTQRRIWEALNDDASDPSMVIFDEAHKAFKMRRMAEFFEDLARTSGKKLGQLVFATQDTLELMSSPAGPAIVNLLATKIFLGNPEATTDINKNAYHALGLSDVEIDTIARMEPYTYMMKNRHGTRVFTLELSPFELAFFAGAGPDDKRRVDNAMHHAGASWPAQYMRELQDPRLLPYIAAYEDALRPREDLLARYASAAS
jgi:type IV secretory pathway VirB4 component